MNIFKILSNGNGKIYETTVSAYLAFLLDPRGLHGLGSNLLEALLEPIIIADDAKGDFKNFIRDENKIVNLSTYSDYSVSVELEKKVELKEDVDQEDAKNRFIDIVVKIKNSANDSIVVCIENKIRKDSIQNGQVQEQIVGILNDYENNDKVKIIYIYLVPDYKKTRETLDEAVKYLEKIKEINEVKKKVTTKLVFWSSTKNENILMNELLSNILVKEAQNEIEPINAYSKHTIKAFIQFINTDFKSYIEEKSERKKRDIPQDIDGYRKYMIENKGSIVAIDSMSEIINYCKKNLKDSFSITYAWSSVSIFVDGKYFLQFKKRTKGYRVKILSKVWDKDIDYRNSYEYDGGKISWGGEKPFIIINKLKTLEKGDPFWEDLNIAINTVMKTYKNGKSYL